MQIILDETHDLIAAEKVDGTKVYDASGEKMGTVKSLMINKQTGQVVHAILSIGGFLGMGENYHTVPWEKLDYDTELGGYKLDVSEEKLKSAPTFSADEVTALNDREFEHRVYHHFGTPPYFI